MTHRLLGAKQQPADRSSVLPVEISVQPTDETCGPTSLHAVYRYWGLDCRLEDVIESVWALSRPETGRGTLAVVLGIDALRRGMKATLYTFNLTLFDPTWFGADGSAPGELLEHKLVAQAAEKGKTNAKFQAATRSYLDFARLGGRIRLEDPTTELLVEHMRSGRPVLTGLSATYLYRACREYGPNDDPDDVRGVPQGHFVVLHGYDTATRSVHVADPLADNPPFSTRNYMVPMSRIIPSIMLGVLTYDANLLVLEPPTDGPDARPAEEQEP